MPIEIAGMKFSGFWDDDSRFLTSLGYEDRLEWLEFRFTAVLRGPLNLLVSLEGREYIWFAAVQLICSGIEGLAGFEFEGNDTKRFEQFADSYLDRSVWRNRALYIPKPGGRAQAPQSPAWHLYTYFRSGLSHNLRIKHGALLHKEDGGPDYADVRDIGSKTKALCIAPRALYRDFVSGTNRFFQAMQVAGTQKQSNFMRTFDTCLTEPWKH